MERKAGKTRLKYDKHLRTIVAESSFLTLCAGCKQPVSKEWTYCPYCGAQERPAPYPYQVGHPHYDGAAHKESLEAEEAVTMKCELVGLDTYGAKVSFIISQAAGHPDDWTMYDKNVLDLAYRADAELAELKAVLRLAQDRLSIYRAGSPGEYTDGLEFTALIARIDSALGSSGLSPSELVELGHKLISLGEYTPDQST